MKKLKGANRVHPSPPPPPTSIRHLSSLPSAIMSLAAALSPEEQEVLAYLLSAAAGDRWAHPHDRKHHPDLTCGCFSCYKSFWARWDSSPNRHVIHLVIGAVEEKQQQQQEKGSRNRRRRTGRKKMTRLTLKRACGEDDWLLLRRSFSMEEGSREITGRGGGGGRDGRGAARFSREI